MTFSQAIFLSVVQGLTEFLPVSSSGHLVLFQKLFGLQPPLAFDVLVHLGTLVAVIFFLKKELKKINLRLGFLILIGSLPAAIVGLSILPWVEKIFNSLFLVALAMLFNGLLLFSTKAISLRKKNLNQLRWFDSLFIGFFQALAITPGISRSGATISAGLWRKIDRQTAFTFSFLLMIPAVLGASVLQLPELILSSNQGLVMAIIGMFISGLISFFALTFLKKILISKRFWIFGIYSLSLGLLILFSILIN